MGRRREPVDIPGLDIPKAKRYSRTRLAVLAVSTAWRVAEMAWLARNRRSARLRAAGYAAAAWSGGSRAE